MNLRENSRAIFTVSLAWTISLAFTWTVVRAADPIAPIVDRDLEKSLDDDLLGDLTKPQAPKDQDPNPPTPMPPSVNPLDEDLGRSLGEGEDVEVGPAKSPLIKIGERMRAAEKRLAESDAGRDTQVEQQQILRELQLLIDAAEQQQKQQQASAGAPKPMPQPNPSGQPKPMPGQSEPNNTPSNSAARDSTTRLTEGKVEQGESQTRAELVRRAWGHLPAKIREQLQSSGVEEFLPQYEQLMENYFKRLAEEGSGRP